MGLKTRMAIAIILLFAILFAAMMVFVEILAYWGIIYGIWLLVIPLLGAVCIILFQWAISPVIISWFYKIEWVDPIRVDANIASLIEEVCSTEKIRKPKFGIVKDNNPNAFTFGWTRNRSRLVITAGVLKYCDKDERVAVVGHELGHIVHNDFVVMTVVASIPLIFYIIARSIFYSSSMRGRGAVALLAIGAVSFLVYVVSQCVALLVSRYREYYADNYSALTTNRPNSMASALVKIAYGIGIEGLGKKSDEKHHRFENTLMLFNAKSARALMSMSADKSGRITKENIKEAMAWDLWNPWALFIELGMTHPLPAKRINALSKLAEEQGQFPYIKFDLVKPECYWDDFAKDVLAKNSWWIAGISLCILTWFFYSQDIILHIGLFVFTAGLCGFLYLRFYRYPKKFKDSTILNCVRDPKASPTKGKPVKLKGKIIGRGIPGYWFSEDLKLDDGTGLILLDYRQIMRIIEFFIGLLRTEYLIGRTVVVEGWYRRYVVPYIELFKLYVVGPDGTVKHRHSPISGFKIAGAVFVLLIGIIILMYKFGYLFG